MKRAALSHELIFHLQQNSFVLYYKIKKKNTIYIYLHQVLKTHWKEYLFEFYLFY